MQCNREALSLDTQEGVRLEHIYTLPGGHHGGHILLARSMYILETCVVFLCFILRLYISTTRSETTTVKEYPAMKPLSVLFRALVLFVIASRGSSRSPSLRVTPPDSFDYTLKGESLKLIKVKDDGRVSQLQDISPGVYSLKLAGTRTGGCGFKGGSDGAYR